MAVHVPPGLKLAALHHDSHEAFACNLPTPLKKLVRADSDVYDELCARLDSAIGAAFGIDPAAFKDAAIKRADETVRVSESKGLLADGGRSIREALPHRQFLAVSPIESAGCFGRLLGPEEAQEAFLSVHHAGGDVTAAI